MIHQFPYTFVSVINPYAAKQPETTKGNEMNNADKSAYNFRLFLGIGPITNSGCDCNFSCIFVIMLSAVSPSS